MKPRLVSSLAQETARRERRQAVRFVARLILQTIQTPEHEKGLIPTIGNASTRDNLDAVVHWIATTWRGPLDPPREVARTLTARLLVALIDGEL